MNWTLLDIVNRKGLPVLEHTPGRVHASSAVAGNVALRFETSIVFSDGGTERTWQGEQAERMLDEALAWLSMNRYGAVGKIRFCDRWGGETLVLQSRRPPDGDDPLAALRD